MFSRNLKLVGRTSQQVAITQGLEFLGVKNQVYEGQIQNLRDNSPYSQQLLWTQKRGVTQNPAITKLYTSLRFGDLEEFDRIISKLVTTKKLLLTQLNQDGNTVLQEAILTNNVASVKTVLNYDPPVNTKNKEGKSTLVLATETGNIELMQLIVEYVKNRGRIFGSSNLVECLEVAVDQNNTELVATLTQLPLENVRGVLIFGMFKKAMENANVEICKQLTKLGFNMPIAGYNKLMENLEKPHSPENPFYQLLLQNQPVTKKKGTSASSGANADVEHTQIMKAVKANNLDEVKNLLEFGVNSKIALQCLKVAIDNDQMEVAEELLKSTPKIVNTKEPKSDKRLIVYAAEEHKEQFCDLLANYNAKITKQDIKDHPILESVFLKK